MHYIVFDLEFNQDFASRLDILLPEEDKQNLSYHNPSSGQPAVKYPVEIIQFGALKLDMEFHTVATFHRLVKPTFYSAVSPFVTGLTGITSELLQTGEPFPEVFSSFLEFIGNKDSIFCVWGMGDIRELFRNVSYHNLDNSLLPRSYINIQPYVSERLKLPKKKLLNLQYSAVALGIPLSQSFHDALSDAYYTSEIFMKIYLPAMQTKVYDPAYVAIRPRQAKKIIDFDMLIRQFEKMYAREMTEEEKGIIKLAYRMGKTHQFLKQDLPADPDSPEA